MSERTKRCISSDAFLVLVDEPCDLYAEKDGSPGYRASN